MEKAEAGDNQFWNFESQNCLEAWGEDPFPRFNLPKKKKKYNISIKIFNKNAYPWINS